MADPTYEELINEARNRGLVTSTGSVMYEEQPGRGEFSKFAESTLKGVPKAQRCQGHQNDPKEPGFFSKMFGKK